MSACCPQQSKPRTDYILWGSLIIVAIAYLTHWLFAAVIADIKPLTIFTTSAFELTNMIWFGILLGIFFVGVLDRIPREFIISILGKPDGIGGIIRATAAGVLLDLCNHGILMVGMKLYERGAGIGQVMAFLIASPWNSISLTIVLWALVGFKWMMVFLLASMLIAVISGLIFNMLVCNGTLPNNPNSVDIPAGFKLWPETKKALKTADYSHSSIKSLLWDGFKGSKMVIKWIVFGIVLAGLVQAFMSGDTFQTYFGPTLTGLGLTLLAATIIEVCSEGSLPLAADILTKADAPGNSFTFLMAGVATDYTEIMSIKDTTSSWKLALFLPLVTLPQVLLLGWIFNVVG